MAARLTVTDRAAYAEALTPQRSPHWIDVKASLPIPGFGVYVALMAGRERRNRDRLRHEGQLKLAPNIIVGAALLGTVMTGWMCAMLLLTSLKLLADKGGDVWWHAYAGPL